MNRVTCPLCGFEFDPAGHSACSSCPLQPGCQLVCCPRCGYELVDVRASKLASAAQRWIARLHPKQPDDTSVTESGESHGHSKS